MQFLPFQRRNPRVVYTLPKHPGFRTDPMIRPIQVVVRMCPDSAKPTSGGDRPHWFSKESTFRSVFLEADENTHFTILFDGVLSTDHWLRNYPVYVVEFQGGSDRQSILFQFDYILRQNWTDETIIYSLEDDYVHRPGWTAILREGLGPIIHPDLSFDYITLYDHYDKYTWGDLYKDLSSKIGVTKSAHWRTIPSTTNTWACLFWTFRSDIEIFRAFQNQDNEKFKTLGHLGRTIGSCIPGWSTHVHPEWLAPCIDWSDYVKRIRYPVINSNEYVHSVSGIPAQSPSCEQPDRSSSDSTSTGISSDHSETVS